MLLFIIGTQTLRYVYIRRCRHDAIVYTCLFTLMLRYAIIADTLMLSYATILIRCFFRH